MKKSLTISVALLVISGLLMLGIAYIYMYDTASFVQNISTQTVAFSLDSFLMPNGAPQTPALARFNGVISANTTVADVQLEILCENPILLQTVYNTLTFTLYNAGGAVPIGSLNLLTSNILTTEIPLPGDNWFDCTIAYTIKEDATGTFSIELKAQLISP